MTEEPLGILLYGFDRNTANATKDLLAATLGREIMLMSASGREDDLVMDVLDSPSDTYEEKDAKILVFLGFDNVQIGAVLDDFPKDGSIGRPIFCGLTEQNVTWAVSQLVEHLLEEDRAWKRRDGADPE